MKDLFIKYMQDDYIKAYQCEKMQLNLSFLANKIMQEDFDKIKTHFLIIMQQINRMDAKKFSDEILILLQEFLSFLRCHDA